MPLFWFWWNKSGLHCVSVWPTRLKKMLDWSSSCNFDIITIHVCTQYTLYCLLYNNTSCNVSSRIVPCLINDNHVSEFSTQLSYLSHCLHEVARILIQKHTGKRLIQSILYTDNWKFIREYFATVIKNRLIEKN